MLKTIESYIRAEALFSPDDRLLLAVSGGMDSMVMWHVLRSLGYELGVVHCNFQLREAESDADEAFVGEQAKAEGTPCYTNRFATREHAAREQLSIQAAARELRYAFFTEVQQTNGYDYVLTAHHLDDRLETFWLHFTRGSGWRGLSGLTAKRGKIRRPLLTVDRAAIEAYQTEHAIPFREDGSNAEDKYRRNHFRHHILPALYAWTPDLAQRARTNFGRMEEMLALYLERIAQHRAGLLTGTPTGYVLNLKRLKGLPAARTVAHELLSPWYFTAEQARQLLQAKPGTLLETDTHLLLVQEEAAIIQPVPVIGARAVVEWSQTQLFVNWDDQSWLTQTEVPKPVSIASPADRVLVDANILSWPLRLRTWQDGDRFCPLGMQGKEQKLQDFFVNNKIDRLTRRQIPLLVNGDDRIIWIVGLRLDERFKIKDESERIVSIELRKG